MCTYLGGAKLSNLSHQHWSDFLKAAYSLSSIIVQLNSTCLSSSSVQILTLGLAQRDRWLGTMSWDRLQIGGGGGEVKSSSYQSGLPASETYLASSVMILIKDDLNHMLNSNGVDLELFQGHKSTFSVHPDASEPRLWRQTGPCWLRDMIKLFNSSIKCLWTSS